MNLPNQMGIRWRKIVHGRNMLLRDDENMDRRSGLNIMECDNGVCLVYLLGRNGSFDNFAENAVHADSLQSIDFSIFYITMRELVQS
jgi:hypothetical protein